MHLLLLSGNALFEGPLRGQNALAMRGTEAVSFVLQLAPFGRLTLIRQDHPSHRCPHLREACQGTHASTILVGMPEASPAPGINNSAFGCNVPSISAWLPFKKPTGAPIGPSALRVGQLTTPQVPTRSLVFLFS